ncbi:MAG: hypothetical protein ABIQ44_08505 [Chloroflexia bacterium]
MAPVKNTVQVQCRNCGSGNQPGSPHCARCGAPFADAAASSVQQIQSFTQAAPSAPVGDPVVTFGKDGQDRALVKQTYERAKAILTQGESIEYIATSYSGLGRAPDCAVATNKRVMLFRKKVLGKVELDDCWWRDVGAASLVETKNGINVKLDAIQGWHLILENLPRAQASNIYGLAFNYADHLQGQPRPMVNDYSDQHSASVPAPTQPSPAPTMLTSRLASHPPSLPNLGASPLITTTGLSNSAHNFDNPPVQSQAPAAPVPAFIPTPESVLQSILQNSALAELEEHGVPTRPMQWSAAAFQAPAVLDVQPVVLTGNTPSQATNHNYSHTNIDTELQMRHLPPLTTLERIAVFTPASGPLSLESTPRLNANSMPLSSMPLRESVALQSSPMLDPASLLSQWSDSSDLQPVQDDVPYPQITDFATSLTNLEAMPTEMSEEKWSVEVSANPDVAITTGPISSGPLNAMIAAEMQQGFTPVEAVAHVEEESAEWTSPELQYEPDEPEMELESEQMPAPVLAAPDPVQEVAPEFEMQAELAQPALELEMPAISFGEQVQSGPLYDPASANIHPTAPMGVEDYMLPMPGSTASGPLLAAAGDMDDAMEDLYRNTSPMSTQRLDYDAHPEDADLATRINLTLHNTRPNQMIQPRNASGLNRTNTDELKAPRAASSRSSGSGRTKIDDPIAKMKQLKALLDAGLITEQDYSSKKGDILSRI